jgi:hypothetical protein
VKYNPLLQSAIAAAKQIQSSFNPDGAIHEVLELGWGEAKELGVEHIQTKIFTSAPCRSKKLKPPPYYPDDYHHF